MLLMQLEIGTEHWRSSFVQESVDQRNGKWDLKIVVLEMEDWYWSPTKISTS